MDRGSHERWTRAAAGLLASGLLSSGCSEMDHRTRSTDLCAQLDELVAVAGDPQEDVAKVDVDELRAQADEFRDNVNQVQALAKAGSTTRCRRWS